MRSVSYRLVDLDKVKIKLGFQGENEHTTVLFDCKKAFEEYPDAVCSLSVISPHGEKYPAITTREGNYVSWVVTDSDLAYHGDGMLQLSFMQGSVVKKTYRAKTHIDESIIAGDNPPSGVENWLDMANRTLTELPETAKEYALDALDEMTVEAEMLPAGSDPAVEKTVDPDTGAINLDFKLPGSGSGTTDYEELDNKPSIGGVTLDGNKTLHELGIAAENDIPDVSGKANLSVVAPAFDQATANDPGSLVTYTDGVVYVLPDGHTAGTTWANTTKTATNIGAQLTDVKTAIHGTKETEYNSFGILPLEWEKGDINKSTGAETGTTNIRTLFVKVSPSTKYRVYTLNSKSWKYCQYSTNNVSGFISGHGSYSGNNITITTASTANYLRFVVTCSPSDLNEANYIIVVNDDDLQSIGRTFVNENNSAISANDTFESLSKMKLNRRYQVSGSVMAQYSDSPSTKSVNAIVMKFHGATKGGTNYIQIVIYMDNTVFYRTTPDSGTTWSEWVEVFSYYDVKSIMSEVVLSSTQKKIVLLGDSITQGVGSTGIVHFTDANDIVVWGNAPDYPSAGTGYVVGDHIYDLSNIRRYYEAIDGSGWSQKFKAYCEGKFNCVVKNYGMSGINSRVLLDYLSQATYPVPGYDIAIVMIGTNDRYESANIPKATSYSNICSIVDKLREHGTKVILMAATPATTVDEENASARVYHMDDVDHIIMKVASDKRVPFISLFSAMNDYCLFTGTTLASLLNNDGLHPNDTGYAVMYRLILRELGIPKRDDVQ